MANERITKRIIDRTEPSGKSDSFVWDTELKGFGLKVTAKGSKSFIVQYRLNGRRGKTRRVKVGSVGALTPDEARKAAKEILAEVALGVDVAQERTEKRNELTVAELMELWLEEGCIHKKASTLATDKSYAEHHIGPLIGSELIGSLSRADVERMHRDVEAGKTAKTMKTGPRGLSRIRGGKGAANRCLANVGAAFSFAQERGLIVSNPTKGIKKFKLESHERYLTRDEIRRLWGVLDAAEAEGGNVYAVNAVRVILLTGCRRGEVLGLKWSYVDFERSCFRLPDSKTGKRTILVSDEVLEVLGKLPKVEDCPYVFVSTKTNGRLVNIQKFWNQIRRRAGISDVRLHDLRHTYASFALANGSNLYAVQKMLGHKQARTTEIYAHLADESLRESVARTADGISSLVEL